MACNAGASIAPLAASGFVVGLPFLLTGELKVVYDLRMSAVLGYETNF